MRNISGLLNFDKVMEAMISEVMISDMKMKSDPSQFGNFRTALLDKTDSLYPYSSR
jgi:hypothetical protein